MNNDDTEAGDSDDVHELQIKSIIGFDGRTILGLKYHPDGIHLVYPLGNKISILNWDTKKQEFLRGHTNIVSAVDLSQSGKYVASGQINHIGFKACVIIWDFAKRAQIAKHELHKVRVEAVAFSRLDQYLISLGGRDCGNVVVWDMETRQPLCGSAASRGIQGEATVLCPTNRRDACFLTAGDGNLVVWRIDKNARNVRGVDVKLSKLKRIIMSMDLNERDEVCFCGTSTGDVLKIRLNFHHDAEIVEPVKPPILVGCFSKITKKKLSPGSVELYQDGVRALIVTPKGRLYIGSGNGVVELVQVLKVEEKKDKEQSVAFKLVSIPALKVIKSANVKGCVTAMLIRGDGEQIFVATANSEIFIIEQDDFEAILVITCHTSSINDIAFPYKFSEVFATAGKNTVRLWKVSTMQELLRIRVHNFACSSLKFTHDGKALVTAWNDGIIRSFTPLTGRLIYAILNAHNKGCSALAVSHNGKMLISGGCEGQVRAWGVSPHRQELIYNFTEHKGPVSAIDINKTDDEAVSASTDGTCIIWDLVTKCRKQILFANTLFMSVKYYPSGVQILTSGSDRKLSYWEVLDGSLVREIEGSQTGALNALDISPDGSIFVTGGNDEIVKLWLYQEGITTHFGIGHSAVITAVTFSPDSKLIVSTSAAGSIFIWHNPYANAPLTKQGDTAEETKPADEKKVEIGGSKPATPKEENVRSVSSKSSSRASSVKEVVIKSETEKECKCICNE